MAARPDEVRSTLQPLDALLANPGFWTLGDRPSPMDIACELCRAMEMGSFTRKAKTHVQTVYTVLLSSADSARFVERSRDLTAVLKDTLQWWARERHYDLPGEIRVRLTSDDSLQPGQISIEAGLRTEEATKLGRLRQA